MKSIAIIIPAYKPDFLRETLDSIARQSSSDFTVYIGDDASPYGIKEIVTDYESRLDIHYFRFPDNLGGSDLVGQWQRCIDLAAGEEWIWLFSDDDLMQPNCVESFLSTIKEGFDVVHFPLEIIDSQGESVRRCPSFAPILPASDFYSLLYRHQIDARMPEFVFRASELEKNGLVNFDLAWRSDNATVMLNSRNGGILSIEGNDCSVLWRTSENNISAVNDLRERKNFATIDFFNWVYDFFDGKSPIPLVYQLKTILFELVYADKTSFRRDAKVAGRKLKFVNFANHWMYRLLIEYRVFYRRYDT